MKPEFTVEIKCQFPPCRQEGWGVLLGLNDEKTWQGETKSEAIKKAKEYYYRHCHSGQVGLVWFRATESHIWNLNN
jgi:hypothetical protein